MKNMKFALIFILYGCTTISLVTAPNPCKTQEPEFEYSADEEKRNNNVCSTGVTRSWIQYYPLSVNDLRNRTSNKGLHDDIVINITRPKIAKILAIIDNNKSNPNVILQLNHTRSYNLKPIYDKAHTLAMVKQSNERRLPKFRNHAINDLEYQLAERNKENISTMYFKDRV